MTVISSRAPLLAAAILLCTVAQAGSKHAPLPPSLMQAKTVYIENNSGRVSLSDRCYEELSKWGRLKVVSDPREADIIFQIGTHSVTTGASAEIQTTRNGDTTTGHADISDRRHSFTTIYVVERSTGNVPWSDTRAWGNLYTGFRSATKSVVKELRKRIEEQEAAEKPK